MLRRFHIYIAAFIFIAFSCKTYYTKEKTENTHYSFKQETSNNKLETVVNPYRLKLSSIMQTSIAICSDNLTKDGTETTLGNFMCDAFKWVSDSIMSASSENLIVLMNRGGMRTNINKGIVTINSIYELMPFENELQTAIINGKELNKIIAVIIEKKHAFSGMKISFINGKTTALINGKEIKEDDKYHVLTSDYLINGGDNFTFGKNAFEIKKLNLKMRDALILYCNYLNRNNKTIKPYLDGRLEII